MSHFKRFIHFGCWNNSGCDSTAGAVKSSDTALTRVMKQIKKIVVSVLEAWIEGRSQYISSKTR